MAEVLTAAQMRAIEKAAIASGEVTGLDLMERAGRGVVEAIFETWPELARSARADRADEYLGQDEVRRAVVLCGPGNNGGDGFVVARLLKERGWDVSLYLYGDAESLPPDARTNLLRWQDMGGEAADAASVSGNGLPPADCDLFVDALFGTGLTRPLPPEAGPWAQLSRARGRMRTVAVDIASGICADSGRLLGDAAPVSASLTVTFHRAKAGHFLGDSGGETEGAALVTKDIGLEPHAAAAPGTPARLARPDRGGLAKPVHGHKYSHGHVLVLAGGAGRTGAARLAARGALRIGAGLVTLGVPGAAQQEVASQITALMLRRVDDARALADLLTDAQLNALCLGPGLGLGADRAAVVETALRSGRASVLDADALTLVSRDADLFAALHENVVLTPHAGEFGRLFPDILARLEAPATAGPAYSKLDAARAAAARAGCTVLFKGPDTVIADPHGGAAIRAARYDRAAPWLATAGAGDVLSGFVAGLLARGMRPFLAAETAAYCHVDCALGFGPGLIAEDIPEQLPRVLASLRL